MSGPVTPPDLHDLTVLVVDDNAPMRRLLCTLLETVNTGTVIDAATGGEALRALQEHAVDLMICDWQMAPMTGSELVKRVRRAPDSPAPALPVIMVSAYTDNAEVEHMYGLGVNAIMTKPISMRTFVGTVYRVMHTPAAFVRGPAENKQIVAAIP